MSTGLLAKAHGLGGVPEGSDPVKDRARAREMAGSTGLEPAASGVTGRCQSPPLAADPDNRGRLSRILAVRCSSWTRVPEHLAGSCKGRVLSLKAGCTPAECSRRLATGEPVAAMWPNTPVLQANWPR